MKNSNLSKLILATLVVTTSVLAASAQQPQPTPKSAESSPTSDTRAIKACNAAADELRASRILIDALEKENSALKVRLETERATSRLLTELNETRKAESQALKQTVAAKNETIAAKDAGIAAQEKLIETLKTKKRSVWSRIGDILIGAAAIAVLK